MSRISLTGHREERLATLGTDDQIQSWIQQTLIDNKCTDAYSGMANGGDILMALAAIQLKKSGYPIKLHCILPCKTYGRKNPHYNTIKANADSWEWLSEEFYKGCDNARDEELVQRCDAIIALFDGIEAGGVWSTITKAKKSGKAIILFPRQ